MAFSGAGIRAPHQTSGNDARSESVIVKWFAHSPGIPPGALVMLETVSEHQPTVKTRTLRLPPKTEGDQSSRFDLPLEDSLLAGPVESWRVRIVWRGRVLAAQTSANWGRERP